MWDNALGRHLRRTSHRLLWVNALIVLAVLVDIVNVNEAKEPQLKDTTLRKIMLDTTGFRGPGWWLLGIGVPVMLFGLFNVARAVRRLSHPEYHPALLRLSQLGPPGELI